MLFKINLEKKNYVKRYFILENLWETLQIFNPSRPKPLRREKINLKFLFLHFFVVPQKAFIKPFEAPQRSTKIKI